MAGAAAVLKAVARATWRDQRRLVPLATNNLFLFGALLLQASAVFLFLVAAVALLVPLSADPLRKIPRARLLLWPLGRRQHLVLHAACVWLAPATWAIAAAVLFTGSARLGAELIALLAGAHLAGLGFTAWIGKTLGANPLRHIPLPHGGMWELARKTLRDLTTQLDVWVAVAAAIPGVIFVQVSGRTEAGLPLAMVVGLALSTPAQALFGLDTEAAMVRYRVLPVRLWRIVAAKSLALVLLHLLLMAPLAPRAGLAAALASLAVGHFPSVRSGGTQRRWRFSSGGGVGPGLIQVVVATSAGVAAERGAWWIFPVAAAAYGISLWMAGRAFERRCYGSP